MSAEKDIAPRQVFGAHTPGRPYRVLPRRMNPPRRDAPIGHGSPQTSVVRTEVSALEPP